MSCPICRAARLVTISMNVNEHTLVMKSCSHCESRWWESDGRNVALTTVLHHAAVRRCA